MISTINLYKYLKYDANNTNNTKVELEIYFFFEKRKNIVD